MDAAILREADKLIKRHSAVVRQAAEYRGRYAKRTGLKPGQPASHIPDYWLIEPQFNPFYVRKRHACLAHALDLAIRAGHYTPRPCLRSTIPKSGGGNRVLSIFTVVDSAVSFWLFKRLLDRNTQFFSSYAYAYRADRNAHHAIEHIGRAVRGRWRLYVLEYDFSKFFDSINHAYLFGVIDRYLRVSPRERQLLDAFLKSPHAQGVEGYKAKCFQTVDVGIPQGSSLSLFLANVACLELDRELEKTGAIFARYADDTVIICEDYATATKAASLMLAHGDRSKVRVNFDKSSGVSLIAPVLGAEMKAKPSFDFLGHEISSGAIAPPMKTITRMKRTLCRIIHRHLLLYPSKKLFNPARLEPPGIDWDLVTCINELRHYLYGSKLTEQHLTGALKRELPLRSTRCAMSFLPLVDDPKRFTELDGWLANLLLRSYRRRRQVLASIGHEAPVISREQLASGEWYKGTPICNETKLPSAFRSWLYVRKCRNTFGLRHFPSPPYGY